MNDTIARAAAAITVPTWAVGGAVRDWLSGRRPADIDLVVEGDGLAMAARLAEAGGGTLVPLDPDRGIGRVVFDDGAVVDVAALTGGGIETDLQRRDFTINAMALPLGAIRAHSVDRAALVDPFNGAADVAARRLRPCTPTALQEDPIRVLRAARFIAGGYDPDPALLPAMHRAAPMLPRVAGERVRAELLKLCALPFSAAALRLLDDAGALTTLVPELEPARGCVQPPVHAYPVLDHTLAVVAALDGLLDGSVWQIPGNGAAQVLAGLRDGDGAALLKLAALLHDVGKPATRVVQPDGSITFHGHEVVGAEEMLPAIAQRLRLSRAETAYVGAVIRHHMRPHAMRASGAPTPHGVRRVVREAEPAGAAVFIHALADEMATHGPRLTAAAWETARQWAAAALDLAISAPPPPPPLVRGDRLMAELGLRPGPLVGRLLRAIADAQQDGALATADDAVVFARRLLESGSVGTSA